MKEWEMHYLEMMKYQTSKNYRKYTEEGGRIDNARQKISNGITTRPVGLELDLLLVCFELENEQVSKLGKD